MTYIFHVRPWFLDFFLYLEKFLIEDNRDTKIMFLTMNMDCFKKLNDKNRKVYYLPTELINNGKLGKGDLECWEKKVFSRYNFGFNHLYQMERFKPVRKKDSNEFINSHIKWFIENIPDNSRLISLSCDHFVYMLSGIINSLKGGENYFVQPIGFPLQAQVIMDNPWEIKMFRALAVEKRYLDDYIDSLNSAPEKTIHYMKPQKMVSLRYSIKKRIEQIFTPSVRKNMFAYLEEKSNGIIPGRLKRKKPNTDLYNDISNLEALSVNKLFYYPLQFEPEMSILAYSPWYQDQIEVIRLISQSLKTGDLLLLKENPKMIGRRKSEFNKEIKNFHNVVWANPKMNSREIIRNSFKTISITGTATIEAACLGKNSFVFGNPPFIDLLIESPISKQPISNFIDILYKEYSPDEIESKIKKGWIKYSKSLFFGDFIPQTINNRITLKSAKILSKKFFNEVLK